MVGLSESGNCLKSSAELVSAANGNKSRGTVNPEHYDIQINLKGLDVKWWQVSLLSGAQDSCHNGVDAVRPNVSRVLDGPLYYKFHDVRHIQAT